MQIFWSGVIFGKIPISGLGIERNLFLKEEESQMNMGLNLDLSIFWVPWAGFSISLSIILTGAKKWYTYLWVLWGLNCKKVLFTVAFRRWEHHYPKGSFWVFLCGGQDSGSPLSPDSGLTLLHAPSTPSPFLLPQALCSRELGGGGVTGRREGLAVSLRESCRYSSLPPPPLVHGAVGFSSGASGCCCCQEPGCSHLVPIVVWSLILPHFSDIIPGSPHDENVSIECGSERELCNTPSWNQESHSM